MEKHRKQLPLLSNGFFISDGGLETFLIYQEGWNLTEYAAFVLLDNAEGQKTLMKYYRTYLSIARKYNVGFVLESPTWRASTDWIQKLGYPKSAVANINRKAIKVMQDIRN